MATEAYLAAEKELAKARAALVDLLNHERFCKMHKRRQGVSRETADAAQDAFVAAYVRRAAAKAAYVLAVDLRPYDVYGLERAFNDPTCIELAAEKVHDAAAAMKAKDTPATRVAYASARSSFKVLRGGVLDEAADVDATPDEAPDAKRVKCV